MTPADDEKERRSSSFPSSSSSSPRLTSSSPLFPLFQFISPPPLPPLQSEPFNCSTLINESNQLFKTPINCSRRSQLLISEHSSQRPGSTSLSLLSCGSRRGKMKPANETPSLPSPMMPINHSAVINTNPASIISSPSTLISTSILGVSTPTAAAINLSVGTPIISSNSNISNNLSLSVKTLSNETNSNDPSDKKSRIFIGNLNTHLITKRCLALHFSSYGTIKAISLHKGYAFIQYTDEMDAMNAVIGQDGQSFAGQIIDVNLVTTPKSHQRSSSSASTSEKSVSSASSTTPNLSSSKIGSKDEGNISATISVLQDAHCLEHPSKDEVDANSAAAEDDGTSFENKDAHSEEANNLFMHGKDSNSTEVSISNVILSQVDSEDVEDVKIGDEKDNFSPQNTFGTDANENVAKTPTFITGSGSNTIEKDTNDGHVREESGKNVNEFECKNEDGAKETLNSSSFDASFISASQINSSSSSSSSHSEPSHSSSASSITSSASSSSASKSCSSMMNKRPRWDAPPPPPPSTQTTLAQTNQWNQSSPASPFRIMGSPSLASNADINATINDILSMNADVSPDIMICGVCRSIFTSLNLFVDHKNNNKCRLRFVCHCRRL